MDKDYLLYLICAIVAAIFALGSSVYFWQSGNLALEMGFLGIAYTALFAGITILLNIKMEKKIIEKIDKRRAQQKTKKPQS